MEFLDNSGSNGASDDSEVDKKYQVKGLQVENSNYLDEETEEETVDIC